MLSRNSKHNSQGIPGSPTGVNPKNLPAKPEIRARAKYWLIVFISCISSPVVCLDHATADEIKPRAKTHFQAVVGADGQEEGNYWDRLFKQKKFVFGTEPADWVKKNTRFFAKAGVALDLGMGEGRNAVYLASQRWKVVGVDFSEVALHKAKLLAKERKVEITTVNADLTQYAIAEGAYDLILSIDFLERSLIPRIKKGLRPGGIFIFEVSQSALESESEARKWFEDFEQLAIQADEKTFRIVARKKSKE